MNALVPQENRALGAIHSFEEMELMADVLAQSGLFGVKNKVQALALMLVAQAEGEHPMSIAGDYDIIQGKGTRKTHSVLARFQAMGGKVEWHELSHNRAEATFSHPKGGSLKLDWTLEQAQKAKLTGKDNWQGYGRAMLRARLIAEGVRAVYPAAIGGWQVPEEAMGPQLDMPPLERHMGAANVVQAAAPAAPDTYPQDQFAINLPKWRAVIASGRKTADQIVAMAETKHPLTDDQKAAINAPAAAAQATGDGEIVMTYAQVADKLNAAKDMDKLAEAASLICTVADEKQRAELDALYDRRGAEFN
jgi:hypothetical protein